MASCSAILTEQAICPDTELAELLRAVAGAGAVASFIGLVRPVSKAGDEVQHLHLEHYPGMTERSLERIAAEGSERFDVSHLTIIHRCGTVDPGEVIVFVAAASIHRRAAFDAVDYLMDRLKTEAVFWKRERGESGSAWIEPTPQDHADNARWTE